MYFDTRVGSGDTGPYRLDDGRVAARAGLLPARPERLLVVDGAPRTCRTSTSPPRSCSTASTSRSPTSARRRPPRGLPRPPRRLRPVHHRHAATGSLAPVAARRARRRSWPRSARRSRPHYRDDRGDGPRREDPLRRLRVLQLPQAVRREAGVGDELDWTVPRDLPPEWYALLLGDGGHERRRPRGRARTTRRTGERREPPRPGRAGHPGDTPPTRAATQPGDEQFWNESWYFDFANDDGTLGGYVRLGLYPNLRTSPGTGPAWSARAARSSPSSTTRCRCPPGAVDGDPHRGPVGRPHRRDAARPHDARLRGVRDRRRRPGRGLRARCAATGCRSGSTSSGRPTAAPTRTPHVTRYEVPCRVHGEILVGDEQHRLRRVGPAGPLLGRAGLVDARLAVDRRPPRGRHPLPRQPHPARRRRGVRHGLPAATRRRRWRSFASVERHQLLGDHGFPLSASLSADDLGLAIEPVAFSPGAAGRPDGRISRFPRALCRFTDQPTGRTGVGWCEWNQPQSEA